jgi:hypothetical protein
MRHAATGRGEKEAYMCASSDIPTHNSSLEKETRYYPMGSRRRENSEAELRFRERTSESEVDGKWEKVK